MESTPNDQPSGQTLEGWTRLLSEGDEAAWRWFHDRYDVSLLRYAAYRSGDPSSASEIVQQAYLRIARHAKPFAVETNFWDGSAASSVVPRSTTHGTSPGVAC